MSGTCLSIRKKAESVLSNGFQFESLPDGIPKQTKESYLRMWGKEHPLGAKLECVSDTREPLSGPD